MVGDARLLGWYLMRLAELRYAASGNTPRSMSRQRSLHADLTESSEATLPPRASAARQSPGNLSRVSPRLERRRIVPKASVLLTILTGTCYLGFSFAHRMLLPPWAQWVCDESRSKWRRQDRITRFWSFNVCEADQAVWADLDQKNWRSAVSAKFPRNPGLKFFWLSHKFRRNLRSPSRVALAVTSRL